MIKPANEVRKETEKHEEYQNKLTNAIISVTKDIAWASGKGLTKTCFRCPYDIQEDVKQKFLENGYNFQPTGYVGGVLQRTEDITW
jgi:hypothetical protein